MNQSPINLIERAVRKHIPARHQLPDAIGFFVGLSPSNPVVRYRFTESSIQIEDNRAITRERIKEEFQRGVDPVTAVDRMKEMVELPYTQVLGVVLPNTITHPPTVAVWAEGYVMVHAATLQTVSGEIEVCGGVLDGKSDVYGWAAIVEAIRHKDSIS